MAAIPRDYLNLSGYVYPVSLARQSFLEPAVNPFFLFFFIFFSPSRKLF